MRRVPISELICILVAEWFILLVFCLIVNGEIGHHILEADRIAGAKYIPELSACAEYLAAELNEGDIFIACGAGNVNTVAKKLVNFCR